MNTAMLHLTYGTMAAGKSTLALQLVWQLRQSGRSVHLWTFGDRSQENLVTSRLGISAPAKPVAPGENLTEATLQILDDNVDVLVVDEAQFATSDQVDMLVELVDEHGVTVHCFALATDFQNNVFEGTSRLFALADIVDELPLVTYCWCGTKGRCNARIVNGEMVTSGETVAIGDTTDKNTSDENTSDNDKPDSESSVTAESISYQVLCRAHYKQKNLGPK